MWEESEVNTSVLHFTMGCSEGTVMKSWVFGDIVCAINYNVPFKSYWFITDYWQKKTYYTCDLYWLQFNTEIYLIAKLESVQASTSEIKH